MIWNKIPERVKTVLIYAPIPLFMVIFSPMTAWIVFTVLAVMANLEWRRIVLGEGTDFSNQRTQIAVAGTVLAMLAALWNPFVALLLPVAFGAFVDVQSHPESRRDIVLAQIVPSYVGILAYIVRSGDDGLAMLGLALVITSVSDTAAYFVGKAIGKHKFAPKISPNKTWEGAIGGWFFAIVAAWIYCAIFVPSIAAWPFFAKLALFWVMALAGQMGDLAESSIKRKYDVKDSSDIFPGHGGVMDRFDSFSTVILVLGAVQLIFGL